MECGGKPSRIFIRN